MLDWVPEVDGVLKIDVVPEVDGVSNASGCKEAVSEMTGVSATGCKFSYKIKVI